MAGWTTKIRWASGGVEARRGALRIALPLMASMLALGLEAAATAPPAAAAQAATAQPPTLAERARDVLAAYCDQCREAHADGDALDLDALAENPGLVTPARPDASRIYQRLLALQAHPRETVVDAPDKGGPRNPSRNDTAHGDAAPSPTPHPVPTPADIETVRDWIAALPERDAACRDRAPVTSAEAEAQIDRWIEQVGAAEAAGTRFVSLVHLWNACVAPDRFKAYREATATLLAALARRSRPAPVDTLGDASAILAVRSVDLALLAGEWERLTAGAPAMLERTVPADWLAAHLLAGPKDASGAVDPAFDVRFDGAGQRAVATLARAWTQHVDLLRAAAERAESPRTLAAELAGIEDEHRLAARRLLYGALARADWQRLSVALDGRAAPDTGTARPPVPEGEIDIVLWTDKTVYRPRDLLTINVSVSTACHLTLVNVGSDGRAIVLFPNELEPDNLIAPQVAVRVPGREAGYQLRFSESGAEDLIAVCQRQSRQPDGIAYDYERQRFAILGDWRTFLRMSPDNEKKIRERRSAEATRRKRRGRTPPAPAEPPAVGAEDPVVAEGRAAIRLTIAPGGT